MIILPTLQHWITDPKKPLLKTYDLHLWKINFNDLKKHSNQLQKILSHDELIRANQYHFLIDQEKYIIGRAATRKILSYYLEKAPESIMFSYNKLGKPYLKDTDLQFNVSHSQDVFLLGLTKEQAIGIDVEHCQPKLNFLEIAQTSFSDQEYKRFLLLKSSDITLAFYRFWTRKEAILKAMGQGLFFPLDKIEVPFLPEEKLIGKNLAFSNHPESFWKITEVIPKEQYLAAIATTQTPRTLLLLNFSI